MVFVTCQCRHGFQVPDSLAGGVATCPRCGKATPVAGLRDPLWRVLQVVGVAAWVLATAWLHQEFGTTAAILGGLALAGIYALILVWA